jgi:peptidoglycan hydrolase FlgJ
MPERTYDALKKQSVEMEGLFINTLISQMFSSIDTESDFSGGQAEETWQGMMAEQYSQSVAEAGGFGLADPILRDLIALQGNATAPKNAPIIAPGAATQPQIDAAIGAYTK